MSQDKNKSIQRLKDFKQTNKQFVLVRGETIDVKLIRPSQQSLLTLLKTMPVDERIQFYMENFESIFVSIFPEDVGYFIFAPDSAEDWDNLDENLTRLGGA
ncbi:MAG: hypothetical protein HeimC3_00480 [Candidatus Heimdallarchaeota archaeon LC_3]|nr:MAG: hypothetical protein HeimC3_00480 [Candidatus Heimdallarchaeota archaeon LC_3]